MRRWLWLGKKYSQLSKNKKEGSKISGLLSLGSPIAFFIMLSYMNNYKELNIWKGSIELVMKIYTITSSK